MDQRLILLTQLIKLGVAAAVSSSLVRSKEFKSLLFREERRFRQKVYLVLWVALPITIGIGIDYAVNVASRDRQDGNLGPSHVIETTGSAAPLTAKLAPALFMKTAAPGVTR